MFGIVYGVLALPVVLAVALATQEFRAWLRKRRKRKR